MRRGRKHTKIVSGHKGSHLKAGRKHGGRKRSHKR